METQTAVQLSLFPLVAAPDTNRHPLIGRWSLGRRMVRGRGGLLWAGAWLTFTARGQVVLALRPSRQRTPMRTLGHWSVDQGQLRVTLNGSVICAPVQVQGDVMYWAGEVLLRQDLGEDDAKNLERAPMVNADDASFVSGTA